MVADGQLRRDQVPVAQRADGPPLERPELGDAVLGRGAGVGDLPDFGQVRQERGGAEVGRRQRTELAARGEEERLRLSQRGEGRRRLPGDPAPGTHRHRAGERREEAVGRRPGDQAGGHRAADLLTRGEVRPLLAGPPGGRGLRLHLRPEEVLLAGIQVGEHRRGRPRHRRGG